MATVKTIKIKDIKDKDLLYVVIEHNGRKEVINVGTKTFERVSDLLTDKQAELPLPDNNNNKKGGK